LTPEDELIRLLDVAWRRPLLVTGTVRKGPRKGEVYANLRPETRSRLDLLGRERALIYQTLVLTGLRKNELATQKNRDGNSIAVRDDLANDRRMWLLGKTRIASGTRYAVTGSVVVSADSVRTKQPLTCAVSDA
jgi:hypothetical protein